MTLLPYHQRLADLLGVSEDDYRHFLYEAAQHSREELAGKPVCGLVEIGIGVGLALVSTGLSYVASALFNRAPGTVKAGPTINQTSRQGQNIRLSASSSITTSLDLSQQPAQEGSIVPIVYTVEGDTPIGPVGGVRVNLQLIFSQILSLGNHQLARLVFVIGNKDIEKIDPKSLAFGNNTLVSYDLESSQSGSNTYTQYSRRFTMYFNRVGGPIRNQDYIRGTLPHLDVGNDSNRTGDGSNPNSQVFRIYSPLLGGGARLNCTAYRPNQSNEFGLLAPIGNMLGYRVNPRLRPTKSLSLKPNGVTADFRPKTKIIINEDPSALGQIWKAAFIWPTRAAITGVTGGGSGRKYLRSGHQIEYTIYQTTSARDHIQFDDGNVKRLQDAYKELLNDIGSAVASRQHKYDEAIAVGELYRIGSTLAVCISRTTDSFISDADNEPLGGGRQVKAIFQVVEPGYVDVDSKSTSDPQPAKKVNNRRFYPPDTSEKHETFEKAMNSGFILNKFQTGTSGCHIFKVVNAGFVLPRPARAFEVGIVSTVGITVNGLCNFRDCPDMDQINKDNTDNQTHNKVYKGGDFEFQPFSYQSGTVVRNETRYSFFQVVIAESMDAPLKTVDLLFAVRGANGFEQHNYIKFYSFFAAPWRVVFKPVSGWQIRNGIFPAGVRPDVYCLMDGTGTLGEERLTTPFGYADFRGKIRPYNPKHWAMDTLEPNERLYINATEGDRTMIDSAGRLAETFIYDEIQTTVGSSPEHRITYVNLIEEPPADPSYEGLTLLGINIRSTKEIPSLSQASITVTRGQVARRLNSPLPGPIHGWPNVLWDALVNKEFGMGNQVNDGDIDLDAFAIAAELCKDRYLWFDGVIDSTRNIRQWAAEVSASFALRFGEKNGRWYLADALPSYSISPSASFSADNIKEGSFEMNWRSTDETEPPIVAVKYRGRMAANPDSIGYTPSLWPSEATVIVRETTTPETARLIELDLTEWVTTKHHATWAAKFVALEARLADHTISFETEYDHSQGIVEPDAFISVDMLYTHYQESFAGIVYDDGSFDSTIQMPDGSYEVVTWSGISGEPSVRTQADVTGGKISLSSNSVFVVLNQGARRRNYRVTKVTPTEDGRFRIDAVHAPLEPNGVLTLVQVFNSPTAFVVSS